MVLCLHIPPKLFFSIVYTVLDSFVESLNDCYPGSKINNHQGHMQEKKLALVSVYKVTCLLAGN